MSAMPAVVLTCDSDIRPARRASARSRGDAAVIPLRGGPGARPRPALHQRRTLRPAGVSPAVQGATPAAVQAATPPAIQAATFGATHTAPLRLTRRGRLVVAAVAALLVTVISLLAAGAAQATNHGPSPRAARQNLVQVVVHPGQSLWSVAESADPDQDTRAVIQQIVDLNGLSGDFVSAGQQLWVPRG
jgi:LysM domain